MKRPWLLALALSCCADPAALEVRVTIRDQDLEQMYLEVAKGDAMKQSAFVSCTIPFDGALSGTCPFEAGDGRWTDPDRLSFVVYGEPETPVTVAIDGFRTGRSVTATQAFTALPAAEGERRVLDLALLSRTSERSRCEVEVPVGDVGVPAPPDTNALAVFDLYGSRVEREVIVSANGNLAHAGLLRGDDTCEVRLQPLAEMRQCVGDSTFKWCHVRSGAMAVGPSGADVARAVVGALCEAPFQLIAAFPVGRCGRVRSVRAPARFGVDDISDPVVIDLDGDANPEIIYAALDRTGVPVGDEAPVTLLVFHPERTTNPLEEIDLVNTSATVPLAPLAFAAQDGAVLVVPAATPPFGIYIRGDYFPAPGAPRGALMRAPAALASVEEPGVVRVTADAVELIGLEPAGRGWRSWVRHGHSLRDVSPPLTQDLDVRVAVGRVDPDDPPYAVIVDDGVAHRFSLTGGGVSVSRPLWGEGVASGAQYALLGNVDGAPGLEIVSHSTYAPQLSASDAEGRVLEGWPIAMTSQTGRRHVVITDIDGPEDNDEDSFALRDLELVTLSDDRLSIISLGPGSYDRTATPWPSADRDPLASGAYFGEADPTQLNWTAVFR